MKNDDNADILSDEHAVEQAKEYLRQGDTVEFFELMTSGILKKQPANPIQYCLDRVMALLNGSTDQPLDDVSKNRSEDSRYMKKHGISDFLDRWVLALIAERRGFDCEDQEVANRKRLEFHREYLQRLIADTRDSETGGSVRA
ncbi:hypothetical protein DIPPA_16810 [Diplonema papillatum]|nr:hypothetical protein DIPPA_16810 [Diplonema papillatum]